MTALSIDATDREPVTGWEALHPDHKPVCEVIVKLAEERLAEAWQQWDALIEARHQNEIISAEFFTRRDVVLQAIEHAKDEHERALVAREAYYKSLRDCTCTPLSDACPACVEDNARRYGDSIPVEGV